MDEAFAYFLKNFGPALARRDADPAHASRYSGRLPALLLSYWTEHGFSGYADGLFWTVDPADYEGVLAAWLEHTPFRGADDYHVVARSAFGDLEVWGLQSGTSLRISSASSLLFPNATHREYLQSGRADLVVQAFFASASRKSFDCADEAGQPLFARALRELGLLEHDQMYGFEPALGLGGVAALAHLRKVGIREHLEILATLGVPRVIENPLLK